MPILKRHICLISIVLGLLFPITPLAAISLNLDYPEFGGFDLNRDQDLNQIIAWLYYFIVGISGIAAFFMLVLGGFEWLSSAGDPGKIKDARDRITSAILGLLLILSSYLILQVINPELITFVLPPTVGDGGNGGGGGGGGGNGGCLAENTLILTPEGYEKIQDLDVGDKVIGFDTEKDERAEIKIIRKDIHQGQFSAWVYKEIIFTWNHKIYLNNEWKEVKDLAESEIIYEGWVYNIVVESHNYFAKSGISGTEILIHNLMIK